MEKTINEQSTNDILPEPTRPQFLTVLCVLTWICSGFILITSLLGIINKPSAEEQAEKVEQMRAISPEAAEQIEAAYEAQGSSGQTMNTLLSILALAVSSVGAMMMWQLKKRGFYIYMVGELIPYFGLLFVGINSFSAMGSMIGMSAAAIAGIAIGVMALFDGIFIAMYAANLKHMKS